MTIASPQIEQRARESLAARWLHARTTRDFAESENLGLQLLGKYPQHAPTRRALARMLDALDRGGEAVAHWQSLLASNPRDIEAAHRLAQRDGASRAPYGDFRHIAICGVSFCGSTLMDRLLGALPASANIAESHWLTGARRQDGYGPIDFDALDMDTLRHCSACGPACPMLTLDFRRALAADATGWYGRIARRLDTQILISADKNPPKLVDHDPLMRFDALVLFKSPIQAWMSMLRRLPRDRDASLYLRKCENYLSLWVDRHRTLLDRFTPQGKVVFAHFDAFAQRPRAVLENICRALDLPFHAGVLQAPASRHAIGGNPDAVSRLYSAEGPLDIAPLARPDCPAEQLRLIDGSAPVQEVYARLLDRTEISLS